MRIFRIGVVVAAAALLSGCNREGDAVFTANNGPVAFVRFVNAVSDTGASDWRFVDQVENSPTTFGLAFRATFPGAGYQGLGAGSRHLRVFQTSTDIIQTQKVFFDTTYNFEAGKRYTLIAAGTKRDGQAKLYILTDDFSDPGSQFSLRVFNAGAGPVDVYTSPTGGTSALPSAAASSLASFTATRYINMAVGTVFLRAFASGTTTFPAMIDNAAPAGVPADRSLNLTAVGGTTQAGSALTAFIVPRSVAGSAAANFTTPGIIYMVDRYPPSGF